MQNMAKNIDGCHISLYEKLDKRKTFVTREFLTEKISIHYYHKLFVILINCFGMSIVGNLVHV